MEIFLVVMTIWNVIVLCMYGIDKRRAILGKWRISEKFLLGCAFCGGGAGAFAGMRLFRHKTKHLSFRIIVPLSCVLLAAMVVFAFFYGNYLALN